jgi:4-azaleucine resistance transporter AzlC
MNAIPQATRRAEFLAGVRVTIPLAVGAAPFAVIFGALAIASGISPLGAAGMSLFVFAGSSQFIATGLVSQGVTVAIIIFTTLIVNLRHALYSATLAPYMKGLAQRWMLPLAFWLTDESFVVVMSRYSKDDPSPYKHWFYFGSALLMYANWQLWTIIGIVAGQSIPNLDSWGLDFAMTVTFTGMLLPQIKSRPLLIAVVVAGVCAVLFNGLPNKLGLLIAALAGVAAGVIAEASVKDTASSQLQNG